MPGASAAIFDHLAGDEFNLKAVAPVD